MYFLPPGLRPGTKPFQLAQAGIPQQGQPQARGPYMPQQFNASGVMPPAKGAGVPGGPSAISFAGPGGQFGGAQAPPMGLPGAPAGVDQNQLMLLLQALMQRMGSRDMNMGNMQALMQRRLGGTGRGY